MYDNYYSATCSGTEVPSSIGPSDHSNTGPTRTSPPLDHNSTAVNLDCVVRRRAREAAFVVIRRPALKPASRCLGALLLC